MANIKKVTEAAEWVSDLASSDIDFTKFSELKIYSDKSQIYYKLTNVQKYFNASPDVVGEFEEKMDKVTYRNITYLTFDGLMLFISLSTDDNALLFKRFISVVMQKLLQNKVVTLDDAVQETKIKHADLITKVINMEQQRFIVTSEVRSLQHVNHHLHTEREGLIKHVKQLERQIKSLYVRRAAPSSVLSIEEYVDVLHRLKCSYKYVCLIIEMKSKNLTMEEEDIKNRWEDCKKTGEDFYNLDFPPPDDIVLRYKIAPMSTTEEENIKRIIIPVAEVFMINVADFKKLTVELTKTSEITTKGQYQTSLQNIQVIAEKIREDVIRASLPDAKNNRELPDISSEILSGACSDSTPSVSRSQRNLKRTMLTEQDLYGYNKQFSSLTYL
jgi:hypothetical protein